jgi:hypothetical protein
MFYYMQSAWAVIVHPYQHEFREGAPLVAADAILHGQNPYSFAHEPNVTYVYGILHPLLSVPINWILGSHLVNMRVMSCLYVWTTAALVFWFAYRRNQNLGLAALLSTAIFCTEIPNMTGQSHDLGVMLVVASLVVAYEGKFSPRALAWSTLFSLLGFCSKPYFVIGMVWVTSYLFLFVSKKKGLVYGASAMGAGLVWILLLEAIGPTYLNDCFFHHLQVATYSVGHVKAQISDYVDHNKFLLLAGLPVLGASLWKLGYRRIRLDFWHAEPPLFSGVRVPLLFEFSALVLAFLFYFKLGGHGGTAGGTYLNHLFTPLVVLMLAEKSACYITPPRLQHFSILATAVFVAMATKKFAAMTQDLPSYAQQIAALDQRMATKKTVLNSSFTASMAVEQGKDIYESGHSRYFITGQSPLSKLFYQEKVAEAQTRYLLDVQQKIESKYFDALVTDDTWMLPASFANFYEKRASYPHPGLLNGCPVDFWERK